ncbi:MAG: hypothetical protein ACOY5F_18740 [Pseudomonadota bacterium]
MQRYTIETTYHLPVYRQRTYEAESLAEACRRAVEDDDWDGDTQDHETAGETYVSGIWSGADSAYEGEALPIPSHFKETIQRKADHFGELMLCLDDVAQPGGISRDEFERWLPKARAAVVKAKTILEGRRDPDDAPD